jgi:hypothetical protein
MRNECRHGRPPPLTGDLTQSVVSRLTWAYQGFGPTMCGVI